jgi:hypothetical protein
LLKIDDGHEVINEDDKLLIMATGTSACIPHMIGIKRMSNIRFRKNVDLTKSLAERETERKSRIRTAKRLNNLRREQQQQNVPLEPNLVFNWSNYPTVCHMFDDLDFLFNMHGRVVGMSLSPCHRQVKIRIVSFDMLLSTCRF